MVRVIIIVVVWATLLLADFICFSGAISKNSEAKYLRNIHYFYPARNNAVYCRFGQEGDSLSFFATTPSNKFNPFFKWYINNVGLIPRWSKLSEKLDSMQRAYVKQNQSKKNPLE